MERAVTAQQFNNCNNSVHGFVGGKLLQNGDHALFKNLSFSKWPVMFGKHPGSL